MERSNNKSRYLSESIDSTKEEIFVKKIMRMNPKANPDEVRKMVQGMASAFKGSSPRELDQASRALASKLPEELPDLGVEEPTDDLTTRWPAEFERRGSRQGRPSAVSPVARAISTSEDPIGPPSPSTSPPVDKVARQKSDRSVYKIYGKKGDKPVHTRLKGRAYIPTSDSKFKSGMQAKVTKGEDDSVAVSDPSSDHTQTWAGFDEGFRALVHKLIKEELSKR